MHPPHTLPVRPSFDTADPRGRKATGQGLAGIALSQFRAGLARKCNLDPPAG